MPCSKTLAVAAALILVSNTTFAQQFTEESASRFPSPTLTEYTNQITVGDIDSDGDLDIIFANGGNFFSQGSPQMQRVFVNNGTGNFTDESITRLNFSGTVRGIEMGDIDGDNDLDLILCEDFQAQPQLFENDGNGFFANVTTSQLPAMTLSSTRAQFGDFDNDGDLDLYINNGGTSRFGCGQNRIYENDGSGTFTDVTATLHPVDNRCEPMDVTIGDLDGDLDIDVRTASTANNNSRTYLNDGNGVMSQVASPPDSNCYSYDFGDIDNDGDLDVLGANGGAGNAEILLENDGTGAFTNVSSQISPNPNIDDNDSKFFDYDDDGDLDLVVARLGSGGERVYNNDGSGNFTQVTGILPVLSDSSLDLMVGDFTGDGRIDVVTAQGESGSFVNRLYINGGPVDTNPPRIIKTEQIDPPNGTDPMIVRAAIYDDMSSDRNFFDAGISLNYSINGETQQTVSMKHSGGAIYRGVIPSQAEGTFISYSVEANDMAGNTGIGKTLTVNDELLIGDINCDGAINLLDVQPFVDILANGKFSIKADINEDGSVDLLDVGPFVTLLATGG